MAHLYARLIIKGRKNFSDVPEKFKEDTKTWIETDGYTLNEDGTATKNEE